MPVCRDHCGRLQDVRNKCRKLAQHVKRLETRCSAAAPDVPHVQRASGLRTAMLDIDTAEHVSAPVAELRVSRSCSHEQPAAQAAAAVAASPVQPAETRGERGEAGSGEQPAAREQEWHGVDVAQVASLAPAGPDSSPRTAAAEPAAGAAAPADPAQSAVQQDAEQVMPALTRSTYFRQHECDVRAGIMSSRRRLYCACTTQDKCP